MESTQSQPPSWKEHPKSLQRDKPPDVPPLPRRFRAVDKVPVEMWHRILCLAIACALLPREDDTYFHHHAIRDLDCVMVAEYKHAERTRTILRLVCRRWNQILEVYSDRLVQLTPDSPTGHWPPVKRWDRVVRLQGPHNIFCGCEKPCWPPFDRKGDALMSDKFSLPLSANLQTEIRESILPQLGNRCKAVLWAGAWEDDLVDPERFGGLLMFSQTFRDAEHAANQSPVISRVYTQLTHLEFWIPSLHNPPFNLTLPLLHTLRIFTQKRDGTLEQADTSGTIDVGQWSLPRLRCMSVWMVAWTHAEVRAFNLLLEQVGQGLTELYMCDMTESSSDGQPVFSESTWSWLPALRIMGTNLKQVSLMTAPGNHGRAPINLLIDPETNLIDHVPPDELLAAIRRNWALSPTGEVVINEPWDAMVRAIEDGEPWIGEGISDSELEILDVLHAIGSGLRDSEGVPFSEDVRRRLRRALETQRQNPR